MKWSLLVWGSAVFASFGSVLTGFYDGSMSGMLEMDGFKTYFNILGNSSEISSCLMHEEDSLSVANISQENLLTNGHGNGCSSGQSADTDFILGVIVSVTCLGSALGSLIAGWLADSISRKYTMLLSGVTFFIGSILLAGAFHIVSFIIGRAICGLGVGIMFMVMSVYTAEISPADTRGILGSLIGLGYAGGFLLGHTFNVGLSQLCVGWRVAAAIQALGGLGYAISMKWLPHTPRYLVTVGRDQEALDVLHKMSDRSSGNEGFVDTYLELENLKSSWQATKTEKKSKFDRYRTLCQRKYIARILIVLVLFFQAALMGTFIFYFIPALFCRVDVVPFLSSLAIGVIMVVASIVLPVTIEKVGRKASLVLGAGVNIFLALAVGVLAQVFANSNQIVSYTIVILICIYTFSYAYSWLVVPYIICSEIFPIKLRGLTMSISTSCYWMFIFLFSQVTPLIIGSSLQVHGFFYLLTAANLFAVAFTLFSLPETKSVSLEDMDSLFSKRCYAKFSIRKSHDVNPDTPQRTERHDSTAGLKTDF